MASGREAESRLEQLELEVSGYLTQILNRAAAVDASSHFDGDDDYNRLPGKLASALARLSLYLEGRAVESLDAEALRVHRVETARLRSKATELLSGVKQRQQQQLLQSRLGAKSATTTTAVAADRRDLGLNRSSAQHRTYTSARPREIGSAADRVSSAAATLSMRRTRALMESEVDRIASVNGLLAADAASLARTAAEQAAFAGDATEAREHVKKYKAREASDRRAMLAAFALLCASAAYIVARRLLGIFGVRLP